MPTSLKEINHPLRKIVFEYDDAIPQTEFEDQLLQAHIALHDSSQLHIMQFERLYSNYKLSEITLDGVEKNFAPIAGVINYEHGRIPYLMADVQNVYKLYDIKMYLYRYFPNINSFHENWVKPMQAQQNKLIEEHELFENEEEKFNEFFGEYLEKFAEVINRDYDKYSLDLVSYDQDIDNLRCSFSKFDACRKEMNAIIDRYNKIVDDIAAIYKKWDEMKSWLE